MKTHLLGRDTKKLLSQQNVGGLTMADKPALVEYQSNMVFRQTLWGFLQQISVNWPILPVSVQ